MAKKPCQKCGRPVEGEGVRCDNCKNTKSVKEWILQPTESATQQFRKRLLRSFAIANGRDTKFKPVHDSNNKNSKKAVPLDQITEAVEEINDEIRKGKSPYEFSNVFLNWCRAEKRTPYSNHISRNLLPSFFRSTLGPIFFNEDTFKDQVPEPKDVSTRNEKAKPSMDKLRELVLLAGPRDKGLVEGYSISEMRPEEWISLRMRHLHVRDDSHVETCDFCKQEDSDFKLTRDGHAMILLKPEDTKSRYERRAFITAEIMQWIRQYHATLHAKCDPDEWLFPGYEGGHLKLMGVWEAMKKLFKAAGLKDSEEEASDGTTRRKTFTTHSFRTVADTILSEAGLRDKYIKMTCSWKSALGATVSYKDWIEVERAWVKISRNLVFDQKSEILPESEAFKILQRQIEELKSPDRLRRAIFDVLTKGKKGLPETAVLPDKTTESANQQSDNEKSESE